MEGLELSSQVCTQNSYFLGDEKAPHRVAVLDLGVKEVSYPISLSGVVT